MRIWYWAVWAMLLFVAATAMAQDDNDGLTIHVVQRGENLFRIALQYGLTTEELAEFNGIVSPGNIQVGQRLLVPNEGAEIGEVAIPPASVHVVQPGETLSTIAERYGLAVEQLQTANDLSDDSLIFIGQTLRLSEVVRPVEGLGLDEPLPDAAFTFDPTTSYLIHTVSAGETLFKIATQYGISVNELVAANNIPDATVIYTGQQLVVPSVEAPTVSVDLPAAVTRFDVRPLVFVEGKTAVVELNTSEAADVSGQFLGKAIQVISNADRTLHRAYLGIPVFTPSDIYSLQLVVQGDDGGEATFTSNIQILGGRYGSETIRLIEDRNELLNENVEQAEQELLVRVMSTFTPQRYFDDLLSLPAAAPMTSPFGTRRSYNGGAFDRYHSGVDFAGVPGTPILAAAAGTVVLADTLNVRGNATVIDHGWGVYTGYWHQTDMYVQPGDFVEAGQVIGTIGSTGRVTGAHLHWELWVNGVAVDPMQWVQEAFS